MGTDLPDRYLCPVRALRIYMDRKHKVNDPSCRFKRLLSAHKVGHTGDISKQTVSGWVRSVIKQAYLAVEEEYLPHLTYTNFQARELCRSICSRSEGYFRLAIRLLFGEHPLPILPLFLQPERQKDRVIPRLLQAQE